MFFIPNLKCNPFPLEFLELMSERIRLFLLLRAVNSPLFVHFFELSSVSNHASYVDLAYILYQFKSKGGSQVKEYCQALTKEDCRRQTGSFIACEKVGEHTAL